MAERQIIAVVGATGAQGGGLVRAILEDARGRFAARAITRDPSSDKARELAALGAEIVQADVNDEDSLARAFAGAHGAFCVTFFWEHFSPAKEKEHARNMAQAASRAKIQHLVWSTLEDSRTFVPLDDDRMPTLMGSYKVPHFDAKAEADRFFAEAGVPTTYLLTSFYWDNLIHFGMGPQPQADGALSFVLPMDQAKLPGIAAEDIGRCALGIFARGEEFVGKRVGIAGEHLSGAEMAAALTAALGKTVVHAAVSPEAYRGFGFPGAEDLGNMFQFNRDFAPDFCRVRNVAESRELNPRLQTFAKWLERNKHRLPSQAQSASE
jgi:uncharacterized protein YbjT (DUF2867 family)